MRRAICPASATIRCLSNGSAVPLPESAPFTTQAVGSIDALPVLRTAERFPTLAVSAGPGELAQRAQAVLAAQDELARQ